MTARPRLSIVIPAYNESDRLPGTLARLAECCPDAETEVIVVDDGSSDNTSEVAKRGVPGHPPPLVITLPENRGKGAAVRAGVAASSGELVLTMDADLATDIGDLDAFLARLDDADVVVGSRAVPGATVRDATRLRIMMGRTFNRMVRVLTRLHVHDSQCGFKAFRGDSGRLAFSLATVDGFAFDPEVLMISNYLGLRIVEVPVNWTAVDGSSVRPIRDSLGTGWSLLVLTVRLRPQRVRAAASARGWDPAAATQS